MPLTSPIAFTTSTGYGSQNDNYIAFGQIPDNDPSLFNVRGQTLGNVTLTGSTALTTGLYNVPNSQYSASTAVYGSMSLNTTPVGGATAVTTTPAMNLYGYGAQAPAYQISATGSITFSQAKLDLVASGLFRKYPQAFSGTMPLNPGANYTAPTMTTNGILPFNTNAVPTTASVLSRVCAVSVAAVMSHNGPNLYYGNAYAYLWIYGVNNMTQTNGISTLGTLPVNTAQFTGTGLKNLERAYIPW